jgi:DNA-binding PadR family transcriptional regulator
MTGYAIREAIRDVLGHFWSESFGQIYPTLAALEEAGLVVRGDGAQRSAPYAITTAGEAYLRELLAQPIQRTPPRDGLMLRLFFGRITGDDRCRALLNDVRSEAQRRLDMFAALRTEIATEPQYARDAPYWLLTVSAGEHAARATIAWSDESLAALDSIASAEPDADPA